MWVLMITLMTTKATAISQIEFNTQSTCVRAGEGWAKHVRANWQDRVEVIAICVEK